MSKVVNHVPGMLQYQGGVSNQFGKDSTGKINYKFNQQGFRSDIDFNFVPDYAFFGCSLVFGIGVTVENVFSSYFISSQNYGLAGTYNNDDVYIILDAFLKSDLYSQHTKIVVVWTNRHTENLDTYYHNLKDYDIKHFFCGEKLPYNNCYAMLKNLDNDVSATHMGPKTHQFFYKFLWSLLNR